MNKSEPNGGEFTVIRENRCDRPLQPLPLEEPVEEHAVQVVSEGRHTQVVMDESGKGGGTTAGKMLRNSFACVTPPRPHCFLRFSHMNSRLVVRS